MLVKRVTMAKNFGPPDQATMRMAWQFKGTPATGTLELVGTPEMGLWGWLGVWEWKKGPLKG